MRLSAALVLGLFLLAHAASTDDLDFKIIVSAESQIDSMPRRDIARVFLKRNTTWPDGSAIVPVDQSSRSPVRSLFTNAVLHVEGFGKMSAVQNYWQQQIFSGRGSPPRIMDGDAAVIEFVTANPGAIGYVSSQADVSAVRTVAIED